MQHPYAALAGEYTTLLARMQVTRPALINAVAGKLVALAGAGHYEQVSHQDEIPQAFIATSFEREASSNFHLSPAQGDPWDRPSIHVPAHRGPFASWTQAALDAYHLDGLDAIGAANWSEERFCFEGELFNGFGYRAHGVHSPYLWAGTNNYEAGKFTSDGVFSRVTVDQQLGIVPVMRRMIELAPELAFAPKVASVAVPIQAPPDPAPLPDGLASHGGHGTRWLQHALNGLKGDGTPLAEDGSYGRRTRAAVLAFQRTRHLQPDGIAGPATAAALEQALAA